MDEGNDYSAWSAQLRRAVIAVRPDFFGLLAEQRLRYRVDLPAEDRRALVAALLSAHGVPDAEDAAERESHGAVSIDLKNQINEWLQPLIGIGEDSFSLNESFEAGMSIADFPTLLAYDQHGHAFQQNARAAIDSGYARRPYAGSLHATWGRCMVGGRLCYLTLSMLGAHISGVIEEVAAAEIQRCIPHSYRPGPDDGQIEQGMIRWDRRLDAGGQEGMLEELQSRVWTHLAQRHDELLTEQKDSALGGIFLLEPPFASDTDEQQVLVVFTDPTALARIRFASFMSDCHGLSLPLDRLAELERQEGARMTMYVADQYRELMKSFDPKVVRLRRGRKLMVSPQMFRDLE